MSEKATSKEFRRKKSIEELLSTEKTYVHLMSKLVEHFVVYLRSNRSTLQPEDYHILFPADIHAILGLNQTFLKELTKIIESKDFNNKNTSIGDIIYDFCPHFKMYQNYLNNYQYAVTRLAQLRQKKGSAFSLYCESQQSQPYFNNLPIEHLIILPIQRMPRYKMLLEEIIKHTEANHPDLKQLQNALAKISEVNNVINHRMKEFDQRIEVQNIENRFNGKITNLVTPSRKYIKQGTLCKIETKDDQYYLFILFSDCILYASRGMIGDSLIFGNLLYFNSKFVIKETSDSVNLNSLQNLFEIHSTSESFMVYDETKEAMNDWIECITKAYSEYMSFPASTNEDELKLYPKTLFIPNDFSEKCMLKGCHHKFSVVNRRHHCRYCGLLICSKCSSSQLQSRPTRIRDLEHTKPRMVRVCDNCYKAYKPADSQPHSLSRATSSISSSSTSLWNASKRISDKTKPTQNESGRLIKQRSLASFAAIQQKELMQAFEKRAKKVEEDDIRRMSQQKEKGQKIKVPKPKPTPRRSAVIQFLEHDIEPKLIKLEAEKMNLEETVQELQAANDALTQRVRRLENEVKRRDEVIKRFQLNAKAKIHAPPRVPPPPSMVGLSQSMSPIADIDEAYTSDEEDDDKHQSKICTQCNSEIIGRALKTKDGLYHKLCLVCDECKDPLPGNKYTIVFGSDGKTIKLCAKCRNDEDNVNVQNHLDSSLNRRDTYCAALDMD